MNKSAYKHVAAFLLIPFFIVLIAILSILNLQGIFEPPYLLLILNTTLLGLIPLYIAYISLKTFRDSPMPGILFLGAGMLVIGAGAIVAGWAVGLPEGANLSVTIYNSAFFAGAIFSLASSLTYLNPQLLGGRANMLADGTVVYGIVLAGIIVFTAATFSGLVPPYFIQGSGPTVLRQSILGGTILLFVLASVHFSVSGTRNRDGFFILFAVALALFAIGLWGVFLQPAVGSPIGWAGRITQYFGCSFLLVAFITLRKEARQENIPIGDALSRFFGQSREGYEMLVAVNPDAIVVVQDNRFLFVNEAALRLFGAASLDDLNQKNVIDFVDAGDRIRIAEWFDQITSGPELVSGEIRIVKLDGTVACAAARAVPIHYAGGSAVLATLRDISERKQAEYVLRESEERSRLAQDVAHVGIWDWDSRTGRLNCTPELKRIYGYGPETFPGTYEGIRSRIHPDDIARIERLKEEAASGSRRFAFDFRVVLPTGETRWIGCTGSVTCDAGGRPVRIIGVDMDITERKKTEDALYRSVQQVRDRASELDAILAVAPVPIFIAHDAAGQHITGNPAADRLLRIPYGGEMSLTAPADRRPHNYKCVRDGRELTGDELPAQHAARGLPVDNYEFDIVFDDGVVRHVIGNGKPLLDEQGQPRGSILTVLDITGRKHAEEALRESERRERERALELAALLDAVPVPVIIAHDSDCSQLLGNRAANELLKLPDGGEISLNAPLERRPRHYKAVKEGRELESDELPIRRAAKGENVQNFEYTLMFDDGTTRELAAFGTPLRDDRGNPRGAIYTLVDITEHKMAEEALKQKQAEIQALFENIPAGIVLYDATPPYTVLVHNRYYQELFNEPFRSDGMTGLNVYDYAAGVEAAGVVAVFDEVAHTQQPKQFLDFPYRSDPPNERWFNWYVAPIVIDRKTVSLVSMSLDVTKWHRAKEEVQKSRDELESRVQERTAELKIALEKVGNERQRLYDVLESIPAMVCLLTPDYRIAFANRSFRGRFGESVVGKVCHEVRFGKADPCPFCESFEVLKTGRPHSWEVTTPDGTVISAHDFPFTDTDGTKMILEMDVDITKSRKMEEKIRQISAYNRNLIEASLDPLVTIRPDGKIGDVNEATIRVTGYSREELIGTGFSRYFTDPGQAEAGYLAVFRDGSVTDFALEIQHRDGRVIPVLYNASVFRDARGDIAGVFAAARDITEQKKAQEELRKSHDLLESRVRERTAELARRNDELAAVEEELRKNNEELARNEREIRDALAEKEVLLAEIHHRVKNNLSAFISLLSLEGSYDDTPAGIAMKNDLQNRARSMALIHETLYKTYQFSSVDMQVYLTTLVDQIVGSYQSRIAVDAFVHAEDISLDLGRATPAGLIVNELVTNSLKYAFPADSGIRMPTITVAMVKDDGKYFLHVKDNGIGLPRDFNVESTKTLGIKLVNFLARHQIRATIEVNSSNGTEFVFRFAEERKNSGEC